MEILDPEQAFLSGVVYDEDKDLHGLSEDNFYVLRHKEIFRAIQELKLEQSPIDLMSIKEKLPNIDNFELINILNTNYTSADNDRYARLLKNKTKKVELHKIASKMIMYADNVETVNGEVYDFANELLSLNTMSEDNYSIDTDIYNLQGYLLDRKGKELFGRSWGENLAFLDRYTKGIQKGRTYRIGAPSNLGKSWLIYGVINNLLKQGAKVAFFTLENEKSFSFSNILANYQGVNSYHIEDGTVEADIDYLKNNEGKFIVVDNCYELGEIFTKCMEIKPDVVILDYIGLVQIKKTNEDSKYTEYSKQVQEFVKKSRVSWLDLSNLPKNQEDEEQIRLGGGFYGSSFLRNNTDVGIHLTYYKPFYEWKKGVLQGDDDFDAIFTGVGGEEKDRIRNYQVAHLIITKNRIGTAKVETIYKIDFNKGGRYIEATPEELSRWSKT